MNTKDLNLVRLNRSAQLKQMRLSASIGKTEMSQLSGLHLATIYRIESGDVQWHIDSEIIYVNTIEKYMAQKKGLTI